jgi:Fe-S cluster assembly protein SufD
MNVMPAFLQQQNEFRDAPRWLADYREKHRQDFLARGLPQRKNEYWKYADFSFLQQETFSPAKQINADHLKEVIHQHSLHDSTLMVLVNGAFMPSLSDMNKLPANVIVTSMREALQNHAAIIEANMPAINAERFPFASLNAAQFTDGLFLMLPNDCELSTPLHVLSLAVEKDFIAHPRHMILLGKNSRLTLMEECSSQETSAYMMNQVTTIHLDDHAHLVHCKLQREGKKAIHLANHFIHQQKDSVYSHVNFSAGALVARDDVVVTLLEKGAQCQTGGFYHLREANQYIDNHIEINHEAAHSSSDMLYKGIVDNRSRAVFNGRLYVKQDAQKILAHQANHNLLLSTQAEVYSKPELEIYADDVKCKHGATIGQLDQDALFYMCSRGIPYADAVNILLRGFAEEILDRVTHAGMKKRVQEAL